MLLSIAMTSLGLGAWRLAEANREYGATCYLLSLLHLRPNSAATYATHLRNHAFPALGDRCIGTITRSDVQSFVTATAGRLAPSTLETVYAVLRVMMQAAVTDDPQVIPSSPFTRIRLPRAERRVVQLLPAAAIAALYEAITPRTSSWWCSARGLGLREGESFGLTVPRVDLLRRRVHVREQAQAGQLAPLKTEASRRMVPADDWVPSGITAHLQRYGPGPFGVIVTNAAGRIAQRNSFGHCWRSAVRAARLPLGTRYHDLRHFYASALIAALIGPGGVFTALGDAGRRVRRLLGRPGATLVPVAPARSWRIDETP